MVQYYRAYQKNLLPIAWPLYKLRQTRVNWNWSSKSEQAFQFLKSKLHSSNIFAYIDESIPVGYVTDASELGIGAVLFHIYDNGNERPIQYSSKTLTAAKRNYAQIEKEALSIITSVRKFYKFLLGRRFVLRTDHKPLLKILRPGQGDIRYLLGTT